MARSNTNNLIKGVLQPLILHLLKENGRMYGYEITQKVKQITDGKIVLTEGSLYPALQKLEADNILSTEIEYYGNRPRKYYLLKAKGKVEVKQRLGEMTDFIQLMTLIFKPQIT
jgi:PadR family transcriptional regulator, regulatory protein PadR